MSYSTTNLEGLPDGLALVYSAYRAFVKEAIATHYGESLTREREDSATGIPSVFDHDLPALHATVFEPTRQYLARGGKMLRPMLVAMTLAAYGKDPLEYGAFLAAIEAMEDSSIIMDDYIDNSERRRGGPCAHVLHGFQLDNISSCTMFAQAHAVFYNNELGLPEETLGRLLDAVTEEWLQMAYGQLEEFYWTEDNINNVTIDQYFQETIARCAFLTFRGPLKYAAIIGGAPAEDLPILARIGEYLLIGYHIRGDNLDLKPDSKAWGKVAGEDITIGRRTLLINETLRQATPEDRAVIEEIINERTDDEDKKQTVYRMIMKYGILQQAEALAELFNEKTKAEIARLSLPEDSRRMLQEFSDYCMMTRKI